MYSEKGKCSSIKKKLIMYGGIFLLIYIFNFFIFRLMPGDPLDFGSSDISDNSMSINENTNYDNLQKYYGFDKPLGIQFIDNIKQNIKGDFGNSIFYKQSVTSLIGQKLPWTLYIVFLSLVISLIVGIIVAFISLKYIKLDIFIYGFLNVVSEIPSFLIGVVLLFTLAINVDFLPLSGGQTPFIEYESFTDFIVDIIRYSILPVASLVIVNVGSFYLVARASFFNIIEKEYVLTAKAKGLKDYKILISYILKNSLPPIINKFFLGIGVTLGGSLLVENIFAYPGIGLLLRNAVNQRDYILIQAIFLVSTLFILVSNIMADIVNEKLIKKEGRGI
ncbi:ABC transporter permease [Romboutsia sedimentorum]|uniref:ABC transporter permease n=1 Tax=Romboutsia sedimentorum TaxID=1368474 RepID=UPI0024DED538|nr:ABC transporter permease [Romboutsia sedimentorum]MDK2585293.1 ABC transporter permease [Romboutsia sedimentorum]